MNTDSLAAMSIGKQIRHYRKLAKLSQAELGRFIDVTQSRMGDIERGSNNAKASAEQIQILAHALNIPVSYLYDESQQLNADEVKKKQKLDVYIEALGIDVVLERLNRPLDVIIPIDDQSIDSSKKPNR